MDILFLGTGSAWRLPEYSCGCMICKKMNELDEERTRTSIQITTSRRILIDPGPDLLTHMNRYHMELPDLVLITHEHGDHYLGLDELLVFKRALKRNDWTPIPVYATEITWRIVEERFGYLIGSLVEKRLCQSGVTISIGDTEIIPFKTFHGPTAEGSVGYVIRQMNDDSVHCKRLIYTSDFAEIETVIPQMYGADVLVIQSHWLNEPVENRPFHMSLQTALSFIEKWKPTKRIFLVHISGGDQVLGDPQNNTVKKIQPKEPMKNPRSNAVYSVPLCQEDWDVLVKKISIDYSIPCRMTVPKDGDTFSI